MTVASKKALKVVQIIARIQFKADARKVVYLVRASNGVDQYETYCFDGRALSCTCDSRKPCYHMRQVETKEAERAPRPFTIAQLNELADIVAAEAEEEYIREEIDDDAKYEAWKRENMLDNTLTRDEYVSVFDPCGMAV